MASNPPPRRACPPRPYLGLPNNTLTAPTSSDPNRTIGSAGVVKFGGDPRQQFILFSGLWFLKLNFTLVDIAKYIHGDEGSLQSQLDARKKLSDWMWRLIIDMFLNKELHTYIWDIIIYYDTVRGNHPPFADLGVKVLPIFMHFCNYAVLRNMLKPLDYAVDIERIWHDKQYKHLLHYCKSMWVMLGYYVYNLAKTKKVATSEANPYIERLSLFLSMKEWANNYWEKYPRPDVGDLPCSA